MGNVGSRDTRSATEQLASYQLSDRSPKYTTGVLYFIALIVGMSLVGLAVYALYNVVMRSQGKPTLKWFGSSAGGDGSGVGQIDGTKADAANTIVIPPTTSIPYGLQMWIYVNEVDTTRTIAVMGPATSPIIKLEISNIAKLIATIAPSSGTIPTILNVSNFPLQTWVAVSISVENTGATLYLNGGVVDTKTTQLVSAAASGPLTIGNTTTGFKGSVCNPVFVASRVDVTAASVYYSAGSTCKASPVAAGRVAQTSVMKLFGYTLTFGVLDKWGTEIKKYTF